MSSLPPVSSLRAFEAAARHLSFKDAAAELGVTPTAISHQIRRLEQHCGASLFRRRPRPLALSPAGAALFPAVRDGFQGMAAAVAALRQDAGRLRVTTTNAIAARWLLPRLPAWRAAHPRLRFDLAGTDAVLDLRAGEADLAIRYARVAPPGLRAVELVRDRFHVVASPMLVRDATLPLTPTQLAALPLIEAAWPAADPEAPTWRRWEAAARMQAGVVVPPLARLATLSFREELHAIEAAIAGQGAAILSDVLVAQELADGRLMRLSGISLAGYGYFLTHRPDHPRLPLIAAFEGWLRGIIARETGRAVPLPSLGEEGPRA